MARVLIVDDDIGVARDIKEVLSPPFEVDITPDGKEALKMLSEKKYNLALVDLIMPGIHGIDVLKEIKAKKVDTKVIMMATPLEKLMVEKALQMGADDFIRKPIDVEELLKKVHAHIPEEYEVSVEEKELPVIPQKPDVFEVLSQLQKEFLEGKMKSEKEVLDSILHSLSKLLMAERISVTLIEKESGLLKPIAGIGVEFKDDGPFLKVGEGIAGKVALTGEPILVKNLEKEGLPPTRYGYKYKTQSFICAPIKVRGKIIGVISVNDKLNGESFTEEDLSLLMTFSSQMASIIDSVLSRIEIEELIAKKKISEKMLNLLLSGMEPSFIYQGIFEFIKELLKSEIMWIVVEEPGTGEFFIEYAGGVDFRRSAIKGVYKGLSGKVIYSKRTVRASEIKENFSETEIYFAGKIRDWMGSPVLLRGRHIGGIFVANKKEGSFDSRDASNLSFLAKFVALALKEFWLHENLVKTLDQLTEKELEIEELKGKISSRG
jgi:DNA-binding response OmpR family regulator/putative methionine-R-sulfoxide reductase with GAF domain